jgi:hypothetical protein
MKDPKKETKQESVMTTDQQEELLELLNDKEEYPLG